MAMAATIEIGAEMHECDDRDRDVEDPLGQCPPSVATGLLDVDERAAVEVLGAEADDVDVPQAGRQRDVVAGIGQLRASCG